MSDPGRDALGRAKGPGATSDIKLALSGAFTVWKETEGLTGSKLLRVFILDPIFYFLM